MVQNGASVSDVGIVIESARAQVAKAMTAADLGKYAELFQKDPDAQSALERYQQALVDLENAEAATAAAKESALNAAQAANERSNALKEAAGGDETKLQAAIAGDEEYKSAVQARILAARDLVTRSNKSRSAMRALRSREAIWRSVEKGEFTAANAEAKIGALTKEIQDADDGRAAESPSRSEYPKLRDLIAVDSSKVFEVLSQRFDPVRESKRADDVAGRKEMDAQAEGHHRQAVEAYERALSARNFRQAIESQMTANDGGGGGEDALSPEEIKSRLNAVVSREHDALKTALDLSTVWEVMLDENLSRAEAYHVVDSKPSAVPLNPDAPSEGGPSDPPEPAQIPEWAQKIDLEKYAQMPSELREAELIKAGIPGDFLGDADSFLLRMQKAQVSHAEPSDPAAQEVSEAVEIEEHESPDVVAGVEPALYNAAGANAIENEVSGLSSRYAHAIIGQHVTERALAALDKDGDTFLSKIGTATTPEMLDAALANRRDLLVAVSHPYAKKPGSLADAVLIPPPTRVYVPDWLQVPDQATPLAEYYPELRELARLTAIAQASREGSILKDVRGLDPENPNKWGSDKLGLGPFLSRSAMREFGASCREAEAFATDQALDTADRIRQHLVVGHGTLPLALSRANALLSGAISGKLSAEEEQHISAEAGFLLRAQNVANLSSVSEENTAGHMTHELLTKFADLTKNPASWEMLRSRAAELSGPTYAAHFIRTHQTADQANVYEQTEVDAIRLLGEHFETSYGRMTGDEKREIWTQLSERMSAGRTSKAALGSFLVLANGIYREQREASSELISTSTHEKLIGLRANGAAVDERMQLRKDDILHHGKRSREMLGHELGRTSEMVHGTIRELAGVMKSGGLDLNV